MSLTDAQPDALARVYARSIFELAMEQGGQSDAETTLAELEEIIELTRNDASLSEFFASRILPADQRAASLRSIFEGKASDLTLRFLLVLNEKERLSHLMPIVSAFDHLVQEAFGRVEVDVYTASPISGEQLGQIRDRLRDVLSKEPIVHPYTDESILGGLKIQIGDQLIDASVASRLRRFKDQLATNGNAALRSKIDRTIDDAGATNN